ncbi:PEP-CTERM sorting domain-containing protein [Sphingomonas panacisoli]|uniref:PEP-CTERM sorting domain-containing protein n=2 Tax=Sphingomonas panacisoli TaxID=1813879 RepID=A0A5B8LPE6_9SPHN|nr:PEP-CTERM sorting domain-containing protein [Sphingomonas panacisoli]
MPAGAQVVYTNDFDGGATTGPGVGVTIDNGGDTRGATTGTWNANGWKNNFLINTSVNPITTTEFSFTGLGSHTSVSLGGVLGLLDSWDSTNGSPAPDLLEVLINGSVVATLTANNASGSVVDAQGGNVIALYQQVDTNQFYSDTLVDFTGSSWATFAHTGSNLTVGFRAAGGGWQGGSDESWGLDNFSVTLNGNANGAVPEPATWAMMVMGFGAVGGALRSRRKATLRYA